MSGERTDERPWELIGLGSTALVIQLVVFQNSLGLVGDPGVSGVLRDGLSGGLLLVALACYVGAGYRYYRES